MITGAEWPVAGPLHLGVVQRSTGSFSPSPSDQATPFGRNGVSSTYLEVGASARASLHLGGGAEVAASAGLALTSLFASWAPFDSGFTAPLEIEATVPVGRRVGVTASASKSLPLISVWSGFERTREDYSLSNDAVTVGLRFGL